MQDKIFIVYMAVGFACSVFAPVTAASTGVTAETKNVISSIEFVGNKHYKDKVLLQRLDFKTGDYFDYILIEAGRKTLAEIHRKVGFAFVRVTLDKEKLSQGQVVYTIEEGPRVKVAKVTFIGNKAVKTATLREAIKTKQKKWFYWPFYYTEEAVTEDVEKLENVYYDRGFLDYSVMPKTEFSDDNSRAFVTFEIKEGPAYQVRKINITGNKFFDEQTLRGRLALKPSDVYIRRKADSDAKSLARLYQENGFIDVVVEQRPKFVTPAPASDPVSSCRRQEQGGGGDVNMVDVAFEIVEGGQFRIGQIEITGNEYTQDRAIRRILDEECFSPGQLYNAGKAPKQGGGKLEQKIQRMLLADEVIISPVEPVGEAEDQRDVNVDIKEGLTGYFMPGIAISSDSGLSGQFTFNQRNFDIADTPESFEEFITMQAFKGAGQNLRISLSPGTEVSSYSVEFTDPYWRDRPTLFDVQGLKYMRFRETYDEDRLRGLVGFEKRCEQNWRRRLFFRAENVNVSSLDGDAPHEIISVKGGNALLGVKAGFGRNMTDNEYEPAKGYTFDINYEQVNGDYTFGVPDARCIFYRTLYEDFLERKTVLSSRLQAAATLGDAPPFEKFYAGGSYSIRGFQYRGVSTRGLQTNVAHPQRKDPIGSDWLLLANTELVVPLVGKSLSALFFVDSGAIDTGPYRISTGGGIQIMIPWFGQLPMRFELATPLKRADDDETQVFSFSIGGRLF
jgi:outer membrane protein insertion porin family